MKLKSIQKIAIHLEPGDEGKIPDNINTLLPDGWKICDGTDGTMNLMDGFSVRCPDNFKANNIVCYIENEGILV